jgi:hypothetical protein
MYSNHYNKSRKILDKWNLFLYNTIHNIGREFMKKQFNLRLETEIIKRLKEIAEIEKKKTGYNITASSLASKVLTDFITGYKK